MEVIGAKFDDQGLKVRSNMQSTSYSHLCGAGDVVGGPMFTHGATALCAPATRVGDIPCVTHTKPEIAHWSPTQAQP